MYYIQLHRESTYIGLQHITIFEVSGQLIYIRIKIGAKYVTKKHGKYDPTFDLETCVHISLEMLGTNFVPDFKEFRYFRYINLNVNLKNFHVKMKALLLVIRVIVMCQSQGI